MVLDTEVEMLTHIRKQCGVNIIFTFPSQIQVACFATSGPRSTHAHNLALFNFKEKKNAACTRLLPPEWKVCSNEGNGSVLRASSQLVATPMCLVLLSCVYLPLSSGLHCKHVSRKRVINKSSWKLLCRHSCHRTHPVFIHFVENEGLILIQVQSSSFFFSCVSLIFCSRVTFVLSLTLPSLWSHLCVPHFRCALSSFFLVD